LAINTKTRDAILLEALQLADVPSLNVLDVSNGNPMTGTINATNSSGAWLQNMVWYMQGQFPWAQLATTATGTFTPGVPTITPPADFILDLRNGLLLTVGSTTRRLRRVGLQDLITYSLRRTTAAVPVVYAVQGALIRVSPTPDQAYAYTLWYWQRQAALTGSVVPTFPSDLVLVEYIRIKALEWIRAVPPGSALSYANLQVAELRKSGLGYESENDTIPLDTRYFIPGAGDREDGSWLWMGEVGA
jgi:hypothetical protein